MSEHDRSQAAQPNAIDASPLSPASAPEFFGDAKAQAEVLGDFRRVFKQSRYRIDSFDTLRTVLDDAFLLYDIALGKRRVSDLLAVFENYLEPEGFASMLVDLHHFLERRLLQLTLALPPHTETPQ